MDGVANTRIEEDACHSLLPSLRASTLEAKRADSSRAGLHKHHGNLRMIGIAGLHARPDDVDSGENNHLIWFMTISMRTTAQSNVMIGFLSGGTDTRENLLFSPSIPSYIISDRNHCTFWFLTSCEVTESCAGWPLLFLMAAKQSLPKNRAFDYCPLSRAADQMKTDRILLNRDGKNVSYLDEATSHYTSDYCTLTSSIRCFYRSILPEHARVGEVANTYHLRIEDPVLSINAYGQKNL